MGPIRTHGTYQSYFLSKHRADRWLDALRSLVGMWFQVHYPPLKGVLPIVRSRYWCAIGRQRVLSLAGWTPRIQTGFHVSGPTQVPGERVSLAAYGTITRCGRPFQSCSAKEYLCNSLPLKGA